MRKVNGEEKRELLMEYEGEAQEFTSSCILLSSSLAHLSIYFHFRHWNTLQNCRNYVSNISAIPI
jgi:hypothetical protein